MKNRYFTLIEMIVVVAIIAILMSFLLNALNVARQNAYKTRSISNLKQIGTAALMYSFDDPYSNFPDLSGPEGFYEMRVELHSPGLLINPATSNVPDEDWTTAVATDYAYAGGLQNNQHYNPDSGIVCDKKTNHVNYGAILYVDGHIEAFKAPNWSNNIRNPALKTEAGF